MGCSIYFYIPTTTVPKDTWQDADQTILNTNPVITDSLGTAIIYGTGVYRQILKDDTAQTLWDALTADQVSLNSSWAGTSSGSANAQTVTLSNFSLEDGQVVYFLAGISNTNATTLNVSGTGAVNIVNDTSSGPVALGGGEIVVGNVVGVLYDATSGVFHLITPTPIQTFNGAIFFNAAITPTILATDTDNWAITGGFATANTVRVQSSSDIKITGITGGAAGRTFFLRNVGAFNITLAANSSLSTAANRFIISGPIVLRPNDSVMLQYDATSVGWAQIQQQVTAPPVGGFSSLAVQNGGTPNSQIIGTANAFVLQNAAGNAVRRATLSCTASSLSTGAGGLDAGSVTISTWYSYWFIYNPATNTDSCLLSTSATLAGLTLPSGYTFAGRAAWNRTNASSNFNTVVQKGRRAQYYVSAATPAYPTIAVGSNASTMTSTSVSTIVPSTASVIHAVVIGGTSANTSLAPNSSATFFTSGTLFSGMQNSSGNALGMSVSMVLESTNVYYGGSAASSAAYATGWEDNL